MLKTKFLLFNFSVLMAAIKLTLTKLNKTDFLCMLSNLASTKTKTDGRNRVRHETESKYYLNSLKPGVVRPC